jgi:hypothetical protein
MPPSVTSAPALLGLFASGGGCGQKGVRPVYSIYGVYDVSITISPNPFMRRVDVAPPGKARETRGILVALVSKPFSVCDLHKMVPCCLSREGCHQLEGRKLLETKPATLGSPGYLTSWYLGLRTSYYATPRLRHDGQVLFHAFRVLYLVRRTQLLELPHSLGERARERLHEVLGL